MSKHAGHLKTWLAAAIVIVALSMGLAPLAAHADNANGLAAGVSTQDEGVSVTPLTLGEATNSPPGADEKWYSFKTTDYPAVYNINVRSLEDEAACSAWLYRFKDGEWESFEDSYEVSRKAVNATTGITSYDALLKRNTEYRIYVPEEGKHQIKVTEKRSTPNKAPLGADVAKPYKLTLGKEVSSQFDVVNEDELRGSVNAYQYYTLKTGSRKGAFAFKFKRLREFLDMDQYRIAVYDSNGEAVDGLSNECITHLDGATIYKLANLKRNSTYQIVINSRYHAGYGFPSYSLKVWQPKLAKPKSLKVRKASKTQRVVTFGKVKGANIYEWEITPPGQKVGYTNYTGKNKNRLKNLKGGTYKVRVRAGWSDKDTPYPKVTYGKWSKVKRFRV